MRLRVASVKEEQFEKCLEYKVWGSNQSSMRDWEIGDYLVFKIGSEFAGLVQINGLSFEDNLIIWDNGFYPYRVPFDIIKVLNNDNRISHEESIKDTYIEHYGKHYGWTILNKIVIKEEVALQILKEFGQSF